ncbi:hypothetical protein PV326_013348 [Microctonus aethiopoides]|nr:hypothetical protein PV326_013348 [Microctonus aethiopoides]
MLRSILISIAVITISGVSITTSAPQTSWSGTISEDDPIPDLFVLDYTEYADTFEEFRKKYPMFRLDAYCKATSESIFGEKIRHGKQHHPTNDFALEVNGYHEEFLHIRTHKFGAYGVESWGL